MKLQLTSAGISNKSIEKAFLELVDKPANKTMIAFIPTAANFFVGDKSWMDHDILKLKEMGFRVEMVDLSVLSRESTEEKLNKADVLFFEGGSEFYLMDWILKSGLNKLIHKYLKTKVWVGVSAGSMVVGKKLSLVSNTLYGEDVGDYNEMKGLQLVDFDILPHLNSREFIPGVTIESAKEVASDFEGQLFVIDDNTAIKVVDDNLEVVSEGKWERLN